MDKEHHNVAFRRADANRFNFVQTFFTVQAKLTDKLPLQSVLHVPKLACNLLSVSKLCRDSNCHVIIFYSHCIFQHQDLGHQIGHVGILDGLYYFDQGFFSNK